jgi:hypothetical protein
VADVAPQPWWDVPLRLLGGVHYLVLAGLAPELARAYRGDGDPWPPFRALLAEQREWLARFVAEQPVQTNEVQRCWPLLLAFLTAARRGARPLSLVELGPSAGLLLLCDRYRYRYGGRRWGPPESPLELSGELSGSVPASLLDVGVEVQGRLGIEQSPVDVTTDHGSRLLEAFVWADQAERLARLRQAIEIVRRDPPTLVRGDYVELLAPLLERRDERTLTVVFNSTTTVYLRRDAYAELRATIERAGEAGPLAWVSLESPARDDEEFGVAAGAVLDVRVWPGGARERLARVDHHGTRMEWLAA